MPCVVLRTENVARLRVGRGIERLPVSALVPSRLRFVMLDASALRLDSLRARDHCRAPIAADGGGGRWFACAHSSSSGASRVRSLEQVGPARAVYNRPLLVIYSDRVRISMSIPLSCDIHMCCTNSSTNARRLR